MNAYDNRPGNARVAHGITLRLNKFGWESLESEAHRDDETLDDLLSRAAAYLDAELPTRRAAMLAPRFRPRGRGMPREIRFEVSRDCWQRLESEARRQGVSLERLLEHAAMVYLADIDSGRVANRLLGDAGEGDPL
jgi:predicted DNA-binding ribbon-helix-helix protein